MAKKKVLAIGLDPAFVDFSSLPQFTPEMFRHYIDSQLGRVRDGGYEVVSCLIDRGNTAEAMITAALTRESFDAVLIGAGLRQPGDVLVLFEKVINLVHRLAPAAAICFNTTPADSLEAVERWLDPKKPA